MATAPPSNLLANSITRARHLFPGLCLAAVIALAAGFLSDHYGAPIMLFALLLGMAFNYLADGEKSSPGIAFASRDLLRVAVALLGARLTLGEVGQLGFPVVLLVLSAVAFTVIVGSLLGRALALERQAALLSAGAVAICGASAALAIASVLRQDEEMARNTTVTVVGVTTLSTVAMALYPVLVGALGLEERAAGVFLGATIHDVAQVVGAGYMISDTAGETAAVVKLLRVTCLMPLVLALSLLMRSERDRAGGSSGGAAGPSTPLLPWFVSGFVVLMLVNSTGWLPEWLVSVLGRLSQLLLVIAVAALGVRTSLGQMTSVGVRPLLALFLQTLALAAFVLIGLGLLPV